MKLNIQANNAPRGERPNFIGTGKPPFRPIGGWGVPPPRTQRTQNYVRTAVEATHTHKFICNRMVYSEPMYSHGSRDE